MGFWTDPSFGFGFNFDVFRGLTGFFDGGGGAVGRMGDLVRKTLGDGISISMRHDRKAGTLYNLDRKSKTSSTVVKGQWDLREALIT